MLHMHKDLSSASQNHIKARHSGASIIYGEMRGGIRSDTAARLLYTTVVSKKRPCLKPREWKVRTNT